MDDPIHKIFGSWSNFGSVALATFVGAFIDAMATILLQDNVPTLQHILTRAGIGGLIAVGYLLKTHPADKKE